MFDHPCTLCPHKGKVRVIDRGKRKLPARVCLHKAGRGDPICWGDEVPKWCPAQPSANREKPA